MFLGALKKLREATVSFAPSVRLSARNNSPPTERIFVKFDFRLFFEKLSTKFKFHIILKGTKAIFHGDQYTFSMEIIYIFHGDQYTFSMETIIHFPWRLIYIFHVDQYTFSMETNIHFPWRPIYIFHGD